MERSARHQHGLEEGEAGEQREENAAQTDGEVDIVVEAGGSVAL